MPFHLSISLLSTDKLKCTSNLLYHLLTINIVQSSCICFSKIVSSEALVISSQLLLHPSRSITMGARNIEANSQATILSTTNVEWNIIGWTGPLAGLVRSEASCLAKLGKDPSNEVSLRFHLRHFMAHDEPRMKFCKNVDGFVPSSKLCNCSSCSNMPCPETDTPQQLMPPSTTKCSGYSLLVDVLTYPEDKQQPSLSISVQSGVNRKSETSVIPLNFSESSTKDIPVIENFDKVDKAHWTLDKSGNRLNYRNNPNREKTANLKVLMGINLHQVKNTVDERKKKSQGEIPKGKVSLVSPLAMSPPLIQEQQRGHHGILLVYSNYNMTPQQESWANLPRATASLYSKIFNGN